MHYKNNFVCQGINLGLPMVFNCSLLYYEYINIYVPLNTISIKQLSNIFCHKQTLKVKSILIHMRMFTNGKLLSTQSYLIINSYATLEMCLETQV